MRQIQFTIGTNFWNPLYTSWDRSWLTHTRKCACTIWKKTISQCLCILPLLFCFLPLGIQFQTGHVMAAISCRSGDPLLLPYMPDDIHGHELVSEWVSDSVLIMGPSIRWKRKSRNCIPPAKTVPPNFQLLLKIVSHSLIIHTVISQSECPSLVSWMYLDTQWKSRSRLLRLVQKLMKTLIKTLEF